MPVLSAKYLAQYMTPGVFTRRMRGIAYLGDDNVEAAHRNAEELMCRLLESLGYATGVAAFLEMKRWYS